MTTLFEAVGGTKYFERLVDDFYDRVEADQVLRPLYPQDLGPSRWRTCMFLVQYWGGPTTYSDERGHPRLRMRHFPFQIGIVERDAWLKHMTDAVAGSDVAPELADMLNEYFERASTAMINS